MRDAAPIVLAKLRSLEVEVHVLREALKEIADYAEEEPIRAAMIANKALGPTTAEQRPAWAGIDQTPTVSLYPGIG